MDDSSRAPYTVPDISFETLFNEVPCFISLQDRNLRIIKANRRFQKSFGDHTGRYCYEVYKNRTDKCETCPVEETFADGKSRQSEQTIPRTDGREAHILIHTTPIRDGNGDVVAVMEMSTNITEIKKLQSELDESRKQYRSLFENVPCFITVLDSDLRMIEANRLFRETFGDIGDRHCYELCKGRTEKCEDCHVEKTFLDGRSYRNESTVICRDGRELNVISLTEPIRDEKGDIVSVMEVAADVTEQKDLEKVLNETNERLLTLFEEAPCYMSVVDRDFKLVRINRRFREDFGEGIGDHCY